MQILRAFLFLKLLAIIGRKTESKMIELNDSRELEELFSGGVNENDNSVFSGAKNAILLGIYDDSCTEAVETMAFQGGNRKTSKEYLTVARIKRTLIPDLLATFDMVDECSAILLFHKTASLEEYDKSLATDEKSLVQFVDELTKYELTVINKFPGGVELAWYEPDNQELPNGHLDSDEEINIGSLLGHLFTVRDDQTNELLMWFVIDGSEQVLLQERPSQNVCVADVSEADTNANTAQVCHSSKKEEAFFEYATYLDYDRRQELNAYQPHMVPRMTPTGYEKHRTPSATHTWLSEFYEKTRARKELEGSAGPCLNQHISPTYMMHVSPTQKKRLDKEIKPLLAAWANRDDLEQTSIYGIREYTNGSVLRMHVDTVDTHVISAIINVAQSPGAVWPLQIMDHEENLHEVDMEPGDMVYYESARLLHGREKPLQGEYYANIFVHYKPLNDWEFDWV